MLSGITNILFTYTHGGDFIVELILPILESAIAELSDQLNFVMKNLLRIYGNIQMLLSICLQRPPIIFL